LNSYIRNLDPSFILALAETAPVDQVSSLRDAISCHLARQVLLRVRLLVGTHFRRPLQVFYSKILTAHQRSYRMFQLNLHLPYFELEKWNEQQQKRYAQDRGIGSSILSFSDPQRRKHYGIMKSQFSLVVSGSDDRHWVAYAFVDRLFDEDEHLDIDYPYSGFHEDPIASDLGHDMIDANLPIWDPRSYFLVIFESRITKVVKDWYDLSHTISKSVDTYVSLYLCLESI
jgi:hypothetical protein